MAINLWVQDERASWIIRSRKPSFNQVASVQVSNVPDWEEKARLIAAAPTMYQALGAVRQELWVDYCLQRGRTDVDPAEFNARPHIRIIDAAIAEAKA